MADFEIPEMDPEIADLLKGEPVYTAAPDFDDLFDDPMLSGHTGDDFSEDFSRERFADIQQWEQAPDPVFFEKDYYSKMLTGGGEAATAMHNLLQKYLKAEDPQEKGVYRQRLIPAWWELAKNLAVSMHVPEKRRAFRFGYFLPTLITLEQRRLISKVIFKDLHDEPVHYSDEWIDLVLSGKVNPLATDDVKAPRTHNKARAQMERAKGAKEASLTLLKTLNSNRLSLENELRKQIQIVTRNIPHPKINGLSLIYSEDQKSSMTKVMELLRQLGRTGRDIEINMNRMNHAGQQLRRTEQQIQQLGDLSPADTGAVDEEAESIRQMAKLCVGRQGNHIPFLMKNFLHTNMDMVGTRENVIRCMDLVEQADPGVFSRTYRQKVNRIVPHTIIVPCYGDRGVCWEPFERFNRSTSRGRIAVPMYPKDLKLAVIYALGDLRWNVAKEKAAHYWMEEGLTGRYYQWFSGRKMRGDVRLSFLEDYVLWITKEFNGVQKLDKEVRGIFWRNIPFPQPVKDSLKNRGFVYNELYKKDMNKAASDGY